MTPNRFFRNLSSIYKSSVDNNIEGSVDKHIKSIEFLFKCVRFNASLKLSKVSKLLMKIKREKHFISQKEYFTILILCSIQTANILHKFNFRDIYNLYIYII